MSDQSPTVFLVDDDPSVLRALTRLLALEGFNPRPYASAQSFLEEHDPDLPGCIILDVAMPGESGLELQSRLCASQAGGQPIIFISGQSDIPISVSAMKGGASDFLTKPVDDFVLLSAVRIAIDRCKDTLRSRRERASIKDRFAKLSAREKEVFSGVVAGMLNKQIANKLGIAEKTVKVHRGRTMRKMAARSLAELVLAADRIGLAGGH
ncbi:response regulator transcription factor (plasmid) [Mesorhizobium muleiense]|uniref:response regulator transcription factor n=1 Tax=Mesorhizobium muleiense TaxID=1004279 RepID=UPI003AFB1DFF